ncbi:MAG: hypothetical protein WA324_04280 [Bryobacteraceae bacterium]
MRRNIDLLAVAVVIFVAAAWSVVGRSGVASALASGQVQVPQQLARVVIHHPVHFAIPFCPRGR